jgi:hypothetical protein
VLDTTIRNQTQDEEKHNTTQHKERLLSTAFIAEEKVTRWVLLLEQELLTLLEHLSSLPVFSGIRVTRSTRKQRKSRKNEF